MEIEGLLRSNTSVEVIAQALNISAATVYREIKRGQSDNGYNAYLSDERYKKHLKSKGKAGTSKIIDNPKMAEHIERRIIDEGCSVADVALEIQNTPSLGFETTISRNTIYNAIDRGEFSNLTNEYLLVKSRRAENTNDNVQILRELIFQKMAKHDVSDESELAKRLRSKISEKALREKLENPDMFTFRELRLLIEILQFTDEEKLMIF
jgi:IS30 family transposase